MNTKNNMLYFETFKGNLLKFIIIKNKIRNNQNKCFVS